MATATTVMSREEQQTLADKLAAICGNGVCVGLSPAFDADDESERGNLLCAYFGGDTEIDFAYIDTRKPHPRQQLATEFRRIAQAYLRIARKLDHDRPLVIDDEIAFKSLQAERHAVVLEMNSQRRIVFVHDLKQCNRWVAGWYAGETAGYEATIVPIVERIEGRKFNSLLNVESAGDPGIG